MTENLIAMNEVHNATEVKITDFRIELEKEKIKIFERRKSNPEYEAFAAKLEASINKRYEDSNSRIWEPSIETALKVKAPDCFDCKTEEEVKEWCERNFDRELGLKLYNTQCVNYKTPEEIPDKTDEELFEIFHDTYLRQWNTFRPVYENLNSIEYMFRADQGESCDSITCVDNKTENILNDFKEFNFINMKVMYGDLLLVSCKCGHSFPIHINTSNFKVTNDTNGLRPSGIECDRCRTTANYNVLNGMKFIKFINEHRIEKMIEDKFNKLFKSKFEKFNEFSKNW